MKYLNGLSKSNVLRVLGYAIAGFTMLADFANEGLDILKYAASVIGAS